jgi:cytochrome c oxidase subunit III
VILLSVVPMVVADVGCLRKNRTWVTVGLIVCILVQGVTIWLRFEEFPRLHFRWDENAYASTIWTILGLHLLHLVTGTCENLVMLSWVVFKGLDQKHARDVRVGAVYWYWVAGIWVILFGVVYVAPRVL